MPDQALTATMQLIGTITSEAERLERKAEDLRAKRFDEQQAAHDNAIREANQEVLGKLRARHGL